MRCDTRGACRILARRLAMLHSATACKGAAAKNRIGGGAVLLREVAMNWRWDQFLRIRRSAQDRKRLGSHQQFDASRDAGFAPDESGPLQCEHHLMDRRRRNPEMSLEVGFGGRPPQHLRVGVERTVKSGEAAKHSAAISVCDLRLNSHVGVIHLCLTLWQLKQRSATCAIASRR